MRPSIFYVIDSLQVGGKERQLIELLKGMHNEGDYATTVSVLKQGGALETEARQWSNKLEYLQRANPIDFRVLFKLARQIRDANAHLLHTIGPIPDLFGLFVAKWLKMPIVNGSIRSALPKLPWPYRLSRWCAAQSDIIVANSSAGLQAFGFENHPQARVIHNGIDPNRFVAIETNSSYNSTICMVGNFSIYKDHKTIIQAFSVLHDMYPTISLLLVGQDAGTLHGVRQLVADLALKNAIRFVTDTSDSLPYVAASQLCVLASPQGEGISNAILEYMALGKPVVATHAGGNPEVILHDQTGFLVSNPSVEGFVQPIRRLIENPALGVQMGQAGQQRILTNFSLQNMISEYKSLYESIIFSKNLCR